MEQRVFQITISDNVATALTDVTPGDAVVLGDASVSRIWAVTNIPQGHKIALCDIAMGEDIQKYGVRIGRASINIAAGEWVHLHNIHSVYDERSNHLDVITGVPKDIRYE